MSAGLPIWIGLYIPHISAVWFQVCLFVFLHALRLLPPSSTGENDSFVCILAGCCESSSWKNKTGKTNDRLYGTENRVALIWVQEMEGGSWAASHRPHHSKNKTQKSIGEPHRRELNVGQTNPDEPEETFYGTRQHFVLYPSHPTRRLFTASRYGKRRRVSHTEDTTSYLPRNHRDWSLSCLLVFLSLTFQVFLFFFVLVILSLFFLFSPLGLASAAKSTSGITASSSFFFFFFFFCVLVSWFSFSLCFISPGLRSQRTYSAQLVNDCRSKCTGDLLPSDTTRAITPVNISTNSGKGLPFFFFLKRCANLVRDETQVLLLRPHVRFFFCLILNTRVFELASLHNRAER